MRYDKFIAKAKSSDDCKWLFGYILTQEADGEFIPYIAHLIGQSLEAYEVISNTISRVVPGIFDKNNVAVFINDILEETIKNNSTNDEESHDNYITKKYVVKYNNGEYKLSLYHSDDDEDRPVSDSSNMRVIGNIWDNLVRGNSNSEVEFTDQISDNENSTSD